MANNIISRLMVRLGLDNSKFKAGLKESEKQTSAFGKSMQKVGGMIAGAFAVSKVTAFFKESFRLYGVQIKAEQQLRAQIQANGKAADSTLDDYKRFASNLQSITTVGDEVTLKLLQVAESMGATTTQAKQASTGAIGLSKAFGISLDAALRGVMLAQKGEYEMLQRYIPTLRTANSDTEKAAALNKAMADGMKIAAAEAETATGKLEQLGNSWGDLKEQIGGVIAESGYFQGLIKEISRIVRQLSTDAKSSELDAIFGDIDIEGKTAEKRIEAINYHLETQKRLRENLIAKEETLANKGAAIFKNEQGIFDQTKLRAWAIERVTKNNEQYNNSVAISTELNKELKRVQTEANGGNAVAVESVFDRIKKLNEQLKAAKINAANTADVTLFTKGIEDVKKISSELETLKAQLAFMNKTEPVTIPVKMQATGDIGLPTPEAQELPTTLTTEGTFAASQGFKDLQASVNASKDAMTQAQQSAAAYGSILSSVGQIAQVSGDSQIASVLNVASATIQAVASMIPSLFSQATGSAVASGAALPFPANIAAIATGVAAVASAFSGLGGGGHGGGGAPRTSIDTRGFTSPTVNTSTTRQASSQSIDVNVIGTIKGKDIALANNQGQKDLRK